jgi:hypothetical protein
VVLPYELADARRDLLSASRCRPPGGLLYISIYCLFFLTFVLTAAAPARYLKNPTARREWGWSRAWGVAICACKRMLPAVLALRTPAANNDSYICILIGYTLLRRVQCAADDWLSSRPFVRSPWMAGWLAGWRGCDRHVKDTHTHALDHVCTHASLRVPSSRSPQVGERIERRQSGASPPTHPPIHPRSGGREGMIWVGGGVGPIGWLQAVPLLSHPHHLRRWLVGGASEE